jgi:hypothetical protein
MMNRKKYLLLIWIPLLLGAKCNKTVTQITVHPDELPPVDASTPKISIRWAKTARKVSHDVYFAEYGRVKKWNGDTLLLTYHCGTKGNEWDNIVLRRSFDNGITWQPPQVLVADNKPKKYYGFSTPDLLRLKNGWLVLAYTGRGIPDDSTHNNIQVSISKDKGYTWSKPNIIAIGRSWEPGMVQLPDGEIQLFFSTEFVSTKNSKGRHEQKILMLSSKDNGLRWSPPKMVAFMKGLRDGMAIPLLLKSNKGVITAFESVNNGQSPCFVWSSLKSGWNYKDMATPENGRRWCGVDNIWGGAPYMVQLPTGEIIMSIQDSGGRGIERYTQWKKNTMLVVVGNSMAKSFTNLSYPWPALPKSEGAYFNSVYLKNDSTIVAVSTRNFPDAHSEVWWKEGYIRRIK